MSRSIGQREGDYQGRAVCAEALGWRRKEAGWPLGAAQPPSFHGDGEGPGGCPSLPRAQRAEGPPLLGRADWPPRPSLPSRVSTFLPAAPSVLRRQTIIIPHVPAGPRRCATGREGGGRGEPQRQTPLSRLLSGFCRRPQRLCGLCPPARSTRCPPTTRFCRTHLGSARSGLAQCRGTRDSPEAHFSTSPRTARSPQQSPVSVRPCPSLSVRVTCRSGQDFSVWKV